MFKNFPPDCIADSSHGAVSAVEFPPNTLRDSDTGIGDSIELNPA
jgi:hypothetical protein